MTKINQGLGEITKQISILLLLLLTALLFVPEAKATTSLTYEYDANGNLIQGDGQYYEYNDANQLVRVRYGSQNGPIIAEYFYDYTGQRIKKIENGVTTYYIGKHYETQVAGENQTNTSYYFANGERVAKKDSLGNILYYHLDHLGGTNVITDSSGNLIERIKYYPFGEIREGGNEKYSFTGKEKDKLTEFYYFEARYYNPEIRHFTQADPIIPNMYDPQSFNRYAYVRNNPLKYIDPSGNRFSLGNWLVDKLGLNPEGETVKIDYEALRRASPETKQKVLRAVEQGNEETQAALSDFEASITEAQENIVVGTEKAIGATAALATGNYPNLVKALTEESLVLTRSITGDKNIPTSVFEVPGYLAGSQKVRNMGKAAEVVYKMYGIVEGCKDVATGYNEYMSYSDYSKSIVDPKILSEIKTGAIVAPAIGTLNKTFGLFHSIYEIGK